MRLLFAGSTADNCDIQHTCSVYCDYIGWLSECSLCMRVLCPYLDGITIITRLLLLLLLLLLRLLMHATAISSYHLVVIDTGAIASHVT